MKLFRTLVVLTLLAATGCRSHVIHVTVINTSSQPVSTIIVDYPDATFGVNSLAPGKSFPYVIKAMGTGPLKVQFTNAQGVSHRASGPTLRKGDEGAIRIKISQDAAAFF
jgi:hypothetical protein